MLIGTTVLLSYQLKIEILRQELIPIRTIPVSMGYSNSLLHKTRRAVPHKRQQTTLRLFGRCCLYFYFLIHIETENGGFTREDTEIFNRDDDTEHAIFAQQSVDTTKKICT